MTDEQDLRDYETGVVDACVRGDRLAFERLVTAYAEPVHRAAVRALAGLGCRVSCDVEDLALDFWSDVWLAPKRILGRFDAARGSLAPWLAQVAFHHCVNYLRSRGYRWPTAIASLGDAAATGIPGRASPPPDPGGLLHQLLGDLSDTSRGAIEAKYGLGPSGEPMTVPEIAVWFGLSEHQVYRKIGKALRKMRERGTELPETD